MALQPTNNKALGRKAMLTGAAVRNISGKINMTETKSRAAQIET